MISLSLIMRLISCTINALTHTVVPARQRPLHMSILETSYSLSLRIKESLR